jgi:probable rRNA maturation factor
LSKLKQSESSPLLSITVQFASSRRSVPSSQSFVTWANAAYARALGRRSVKGAQRELTIRIVGTAESRHLNRSWRGKDKPTNVLSFPAQDESFQHMPGPIPLGDLAICAPIVAREAREQGKLARAHWAHMVVHGVLHLVGYDHEDDADADRMEGEETRILARLGFDNPYVDAKR